MCYTRYMTTYEERYETIQARERGVPTLSITETFARDKTYYAPCDRCGVSVPLQHHGRSYDRAWGLVSGAPICHDCRELNTVGIVGPMCLRCYTPNPVEDYEKVSEHWSSLFGEFIEDSTFHHQCGTCRDRPRNPDRPTVTRCKRCDAEVPMRRKGPVPSYCSTRCRVAAHRSKKGV